MKMKNEKLTDEELMEITGGQSFLKADDGDFITIKMPPIRCLYAMPPFMTILYAARPFNKKVDFANM